MPLLAGCICHGCFLGPESEPAPAPLQRGKIWGICRECGCFERFPLFRGKVLLFPAGDGEGQDTARSPCSALLSSALLCASATGPHCQTSTVGNELGILASSCVTRVVFYHARLRSRGRPAIPSPRLLVSLSPFVRLINNWFLSRTIIKGC